MVSKLDYFLEKGKFVLHDIVVHSKVFECLFFLGIVLLTTMASTFDVRSIEKLNENSFHMWKMNIEFL
jgi:hypothetical protein